MHASLVHHQLQHYWDEQDCVASSTHYTVSTVTDATAASDSLHAAAPAVTVTASRRTRNFFALPLLADWRRAASAEQETLWRSEIAALPTLDTYRLFKRRLELEAYLHDERGMASVSGRRAAREMARLRCGVHELAISAERRQRRAGQTERLPRELRACAWCEEQRATVPLAAQAQAGGGRAALDVARPAPPAAATGGSAAPGHCQVEDEPHALLYCPQFTPLREELFADVLEMSSELDDDGCCALPSGPVRLADMLSASGGPGGAASALAIVAGGVWSRLEVKPKRTAHAWRVDAALRQRCKLYVGRLMHCRRRWQRERHSGRGGGRSAQRRLTQSELDSRLSRAQAGRRSTEFVCGVISPHETTQISTPISADRLQRRLRRTAPHRLLHRQPGRAQRAWAPLPASQSDHNAPQQTGNGQAMASARIQQPSIPARQALRRQASRSGQAAAVSGLRADHPTLTLLRGQRSIVTYMELRASAPSAAPARACSAHSARGS
jgi:hypothetical protein